MDHHARQPGGASQPGAAPPDTTLEDDALVTDARALVRSLLRQADSGARQARAAAEQGLAVSEMIEALGAEPALVAATALHPLVAPGVISHETVAARFGPQVAELVRGLERIGSFALPEKWNEEEGLDPQQAEGLRKLLVAIVEDVRLVLMRLAEQLYRMRSLKRAPAEEQRRCARETRAIYAPLASRLGVWQLKWELEDLAFRYLEPDTFRQISQWLRERRADRTAYIERVVAELRDALARAGIQAEVAGRSKHLYSIWRKMLRKGVDFEHIFDVRAVRVIVDTPAACYAALGVVHGLWPYIPGEFDDYIATPKDNNYQSLHTAVIGPEGRTVEVQIRTHEMHRHAELGVAAHWAYKEGRTQRPGFDEKLAWLRQLLEPVENETERDFLERVRSELFEDRVYVLTPHGDVIDLPQGATPLDFAYHVHTDLGHRCRGARVNGRIVPLTYKLQNGDKVEIIAAREGEPSRDWLIPQLGYLVSSRARAKVRHWFRREQQEHNVEHGRTMLERELQRLGMGVPHVNDLARELRVHSATDLYAAIGAGDITLADVAAAVQRLSAPPQPEAEPAPTPRRRATRDKSRGAVEVVGVGDLLTTFAQCCKPLPPDPIAGYVTQGRGVSIHRQTCANFVRLAEKQRERVLEVSWRTTGERSFPADLRIEAHDRRGLVKDVTTVLAAERVNILSMETRTDRLTQSALVTVTVEIEGVAALSRVLHRLGSVPNVTSVRRVA